MSARSVNDFIEATLTGIARKCSQGDELTRSTTCRTPQVVGLILDGAPNGPGTGRSEVGYPAESCLPLPSSGATGTAVTTCLDRAADLFCHAPWDRRPLTVVPGRRAAGRG